MILAKFQTFLQKRLFLKDKIILLNLIASLLILVSLFFLFIYKIGSSHTAGEQFLLHYNIYYGIDWLGEWYKVFIYPLIGLIIFIVNFSLSIFFFEKEKFLSYLLISSITFSEILIFIAGLAVVWINT